MKIALIAAYAKNHVIGLNGNMPWHYPEDLKRFKRLTLGHTIVMGRKTYESLGRPLPKRRNVVLTRSQDFAVEGAEVYQDINKVFEDAKIRGEEKVFVIGGGEIFKQSFDIADELILTLIHEELEGDAYFPEWDKEGWQENYREDGEKFSFVDYIRAN